MKVFAEFQNLAGTRAHDFFGPELAALGLGVSQYMGNKFLRRCQKLDHGSKRV